MSSTILAAIIGGVIGIVGTCLGSWFTLWLQAKKERIKPLENDRIYVEYSAVKCDAEGYYIPGYGRIISHSQQNRLEDEPEVRARRGRVAFICYDRTAAASNVPQYVIANIVPI